MDIALINNVQKFEALYNPKFAHYHNYRIKMFLWKKIAKCMKRPTHLCIVTWNTLVQTFINKHMELSDKTSKTSFDSNLFSSLSFLIDILDFSRNEERILIQYGTATTSAYDFLEDWRNNGSDTFQKFLSFEAYLGTLRQEENPQEFYFCQHLFKTINVKCFNKETLFKNMEILNTECQIRLDTMSSRNFIQLNDPIAITDVQPCDSTTKQCSRLINRKRKLIPDISEELNNLNNKTSEMFSEKVNSWLNGSSLEYNDANVHNLNEDIIRKSDESIESVDTVRYVLLNKKPKLANSSRTTIKTFAKANGSSNRLQLNRAKLVKCSTNGPVKRLSAHVIPSSALGGRKKILKSARARTESTSLAIYSESEASDYAPRMSFSNYKNMVKSLKRSKQNSNNNNNDNDVNERDQLSSIPRIVYSSQLQENIVLKLSDSNIHLTTQVLHKTLGEEITNRLFKDNPNVQLKYNPKSIVIYRLKENTLDCCKVSSSSESSLLEPLTTKLVYSDTHKSADSSAMEEQNDREFLSEMEYSLSMFSLANDNSVINTDTLSINPVSNYDQKFRQTGPIESIEFESSAAPSIIDQPSTPRTAVWKSFNEELENFYKLIMDKMGKMSPIESEIAQEAIFNIFYKML